MAVVFLLAEYVSSIRLTGQLGSDTADSSRSSLHPKRHIEKKPAEDKTSGRGEESGLELSLRGLAELSSSVCLLSFRLSM